MEEEKSTEELLAIAKALSPERTRKPRSDKGKERGPNSHVRSDKGEIRYASRGSKKSPITVYLSLRNKLLLKGDDGVKTDVNMIYIPIVRENRQVYKYYNIVSHGSEIHRTVKHIQGKTIDLEKYRFVAIQELLSSDKPDDLSKRVFKNEFAYTDTNNMFDLFCKLYHIEDKDSLLWSYEKWREHYDIVSDNPLPDTFLFDIRNKPGSANFHPEYAETQLLKNILTTAALEQSKEYINLRSKVYDEEYSKRFMAAMSYILVDQPELTMVQVEKLARQTIDLDKINKIVKERMDQWVQERLKGERDE